MCVSNPRWRLSNMSISCRWIVILDFCLPLASHIMKNSFVEFLDLENIGIAVGIEQLYTDRESISGVWSAILDCWYPLALHNMENRSAEFLNLRIHVYSLRNLATMLYICWAISIIISLLKPPSWISDFCIHRTVWETTFLNSSTSEIWELLMEFFSDDVYSLRYFWFVSRHFGFLTSAYIT